MNKKTTGKINYVNRNSFNFIECSLYPVNDNINFYDNYIEDILSPSDKKKFEKHLETCLDCSRQVKRAIQREEIADKLSTVKKEESLKKTLFHVEELFCQEYLHLIAAAKKETRGEGTKRGTAFGVAVGLGNDFGTLLECTALVSDDVRDKDDEHKLIIFAQEVNSRKENNVEFGFSSPLALIKNRLTTLFKEHPSLQPLKLSDKMICVDITNKGDVSYIYDAESIALAIFVAIISAVTGKSVPHNICFSSGIKINGILEEVGSIHKKISIAKAHGRNACIISEENRPDFSDNVINQADMAINFFLTLDDVLDHLGFMDHVKIKNETKRRHNLQADKQQATFHRLPYGNEARQLIVNILRNKNINSDIITALETMVFAVFETASEQRPLSTAFVLGNPKAIKNILTTSNVLLTKKLSLLSANEELISLASIVDGSNLGFVIDLHGLVHSVVNLNIEKKGKFKVNRLLQENDRRYAIISQMTRAVIFSISSASHLVKIFNEGRLIGRYREGQWEITDYDQLAMHLNQIAGNLNIPTEVVEKAGRCAVRIADLKVKANFVFYAKEADIRKFNADESASLPVKFRKQYICDVSDTDLVNYAKEDGAVLIDKHGVMKSFMAWQNIKAQDIGQHTGNILVINVSQNGVMTVYNCGKEIICQ